MRQALLGPGCGCGEEELVEEQRAFYRARAPVYDEWWQRRGRYDRGRKRNPGVAAPGGRGRVRAAGSTRGRRAGAGGRDRLVDPAARRDRGIAHRRRRVARGPRDQPPPGSAGPTSTSWSQTSSVGSRTGPRPGVLLVLAVARAQEPLRDLLAAGALLPPPDGRVFRSTIARTPPPPRRAGIPTSWGTGPICTCAASTTAPSTAS